MVKKHIISILTICFLSITVYGQEYIYSNQNKLFGTVNPSFYGFDEISHTGVAYATQKVFNSDSNIENSLAFGSTYLEDYGFSLAFDVNLFKISTLGYTSTQANLHYIYKTNLSYDWVLNSSISAGYGNNRLDFSALVFEDQINVLTGNISGLSIDPVNANSGISYFDLGVGAHIHNSRNMFFGFNLKHLNKPNTSLNDDYDENTDILIGLQAGYEIDLNPFRRGFLPTDSFLFLYGSVNKQGNKSRVDLYQEAILDDFSIGFNQHVNNYESASLTTLGTSASIFLNQLEIGANYSFEVASKQLTGVSYNYFEIFILFDFYDLRFSRRRNNSRFYSFY
ncbi:type IX secretion system membrane protein PorP/SprF [Lutibacter citreus]|uniref:type IX secretion system membrane protein PorP/SprF n=1 Tax=Lutibacter citreus TaxID=2138210 RepID=UPI000DBE6258|nr:type IX secretion system membrane protein PorP/SprF [Lutibacter citreus]